MATGAVLGGVIGHQIGHGNGQTVATLGGMALGAFFGSRVGAHMDRRDQLKTAQALETSGNGLAISWRNPDSGQHYWVMPTRTYEGVSGPCRKFTAVMEFENGRPEIQNGTACKQPDGSWGAS
jgi:surface antigen